MSKTATKPVKTPPRATYDRETVLTAICARLAKGEYLATICADDGMPSLRVVYDWRDKDPEVAARLARAREDGEDAIAAGAMDEVDRPPAMIDTQFGQKVDPGDVALRKLRFDARLKMLAIFNPKKWSETKQLHLSGKVGLESLVAGDEPPAKDE